MTFKMTLFPSIVIEPSEPLENFTLNYSETCNVVEKDDWAETLFWSDRANMFRHIDLKLPQTCDTRWQPAYEKVLLQLRAMSDMDRASEQKMGYDCCTFKLCVHISNMATITDGPRYFDDSIFESECLLKFLNALSSHAESIVLEIADKQMITNCKNDGKFKIISQLREMMTDLGFREIRLQRELYKDMTPTHGEILHLEPQPGEFIAELYTMKNAKPSMATWEIECTAYQEWLWENRLR